MKTTNRSYSEAKGDFNRIADFLIKEESYMRKHSAWCLARFVDWKYGLYRPRTSVAGFWEKNAQLWFDGFNKLAGLAISENGTAEFAILTAPGYRLLFEEILNWVLQNWAGRGEKWDIDITEHQEYEAGILERYRFEKSQGAFYTRHFDLTAELQERYPLEDGFTIIDMASMPEYKEQRILRAEAFEGIRDISEEELNYQLEFYNYTHNSPIYHPDTDLCVKAPDGQHVACCEALIDAWNCIADIERVCTHSDFRRRGFARAVIQECLYRLKAMGIQKAHITGYSPGAIALYGSLGAIDEMQGAIYCRDE